MKLLARPGTDSPSPQLAALNPLMQRIYAARGIQSVTELQCSLKQLHPVSLLTHADAAAKLLAEAIRRQATILIVGDFDADGATATVLAYKALRQMGHQQVHYLVPNRFEYGYGLTTEIVTEAQRFAPQLIITVDNGISSIEGVRAAKARGIQVLVTDHHLPGKTLPDADVIVNPQLPDTSFPSTALAGVGVIFYVMLALKRHLQAQDYFSRHGIQSPNLLELLDLVALGTVADVVPLDANNRILVEQGLRRVRSGSCSKGILALFEVAGRNATRAVAADFGFVCGPRLNAAGRLDDMSLGIECLLSESWQEARTLASRLDALNQERRGIEAAMKEQAMHELEALDLCAADKLPAVYCLYHEHWHQGVVGILASRIKEMFNRPVIAFAPAHDDKREIKGSARSIRGIHMRDLLAEVATQHPGLLTKFGGHAMAAGLSLRSDQFERFQQAIADIAERYLQDDTFLETCYTDGELGAEYFTLETAEQLRSATPWGQHFPAPVFDGRFVIREKKVLKEAHLRLMLSPQEDAMMVVPAIAFHVNLAQWPDRGGNLHILYRFDVNEYQGRLTPQIMIERLLSSDIFHPPEME